jgi:acetyl-CoA carboxylase biotin carboxyl carrier protein
MAMDVCAHITGTVWKIEVQAGESVEAGQALVILESMKMELPVECTRSGTVAKVHVSEGDAVEEGQALISIV